jgi:hypothetical protein
VHHEDLAGAESGHGDRLVQQGDRLGLRFRQPKLLHPPVPSMIPRRHGQGWHHPGTGHPPRPETTDWAPERGSHVLGLIPDTGTIPWVERVVRGHPRPGPAPCRSTGPAWPAWPA